ncbi:MAG TPA: UvrD-helicase domain-containing protein, partial [Methylomirabilota bacterium]|nr:UvrD-helicase domain-containing protein [Methylomirabilota bacterium]
MMLTPSQAEAIRAEGNVLVMAGAGTGKTRTLVERCLYRLLNPEPRRRVSIDRVLIVTFTEAAATEIRHRIRERLEEECRADRGNSHLAEQLALVDTTAISTLHSFCWRLIRQHFFELDLDPRATVLTAEQSSLLAERALDAIWEECYGARDARTRALEQFVQDQARGRDDSIRDLVLRLHEYTQTLKNPAGWLDVQHRRLAQSSPGHWKGWLLDAVQTLRSRWLPLLAAIDHPVCVASARILESIHGNAKVVEMATALDAILEADKDWPRGTKTRVRPRVERFFDDAGFLASLATGESGHDPLEEDWAWSRPHLFTLLELTERFAARFEAAKRDAGALDFHDLEQGALRLLLDRNTGTPGTVAQHWIEQFDLVFVDEYQDINEAQDAILAALSRSGDQANRFLVGDLKQSIYRFRLANPGIFRGYLA